MSSHRILVLGASGFIGKEVLRALISLVEKEKIWAVGHRNPIREEGISLIQGSLETMDWSLFDEDPPAQIIHLARINSRRFGWLGRYRAAEKGRRANLRLIRHIQKQKWKTVITYVSGSLMYGDNGKESVTEDYPLRPVSFARQYFRAEEPWLNAGVAVNMIRIPWVFGKGSWFGAFYLSSMNLAKEVSCYGHGDNLMSFIDVEDAGRMIAWAALNRSGGTYNLSMPRTHSQKEFCLMLSELSGLPVQEKELNGYEKAVREAFTSSIRLETKYPELFPPELMHFKDLRSMLEARLPLFLKNE